MQRDKDGKITWDDEEEGQIELLREVRRRERADAKAEADAAEAAKKPCEICGKPKGEGEHGEGKCKAAPATKKKGFSVIAKGA